MHTLTHGALRRSLPEDLVQQGAKALSFGWVDRLDERYLAFEMQAEVRMRVAILALWTVADAICQRRFQTVEVRAADVDAIVGDQAGEVLTDAPAHDPGLAMVDGKTFFVEDGGDVCRETLH